MVGDMAAGFGVQSDRVLGLGVDAFENVNLAVSWPLGAKHPKGRPCSADATGHVGDVGNDQAACKGLVRCDTDRLAAVHRM